MNTTNLILALIVAVLVAVALLLLRIDVGLQRLIVKAEQAQTVATPRPDSSIVVTQVELTKEAASADTKALLGALAVIERRITDGNDRIAILNTLRRIDPEVYFRELTRLATSCKINYVSYALQNDNGGDGRSDRRFIPVLKACMDQFLLNGGDNDSYELLQLVVQLQHLDAEAAVPYVGEVVRRMLERPGISFEGDSGVQKLAISSGLAMAHALVLRSLRGADFGTNAREQTYLALSDLYQGVHKFPLLSIDKREQKLNDEDRKQMQETEKWLIENRHLLVYDRKLKRMALAKDEAEAEQLRAKQPSLKPAEAKAPEF